MTITCPHCGHVTVEDRAFILAVRQVLDALSVGAAPLGAITCPLCRDEVRASAVRDTWDKSRLKSCGEVSISGNWLVNPDPQASDS